MPAYQGCGVQDHVLARHRGDAHRRRVVAAGEVAGDVEGRCATGAVAHAQHVALLPQASRMGRVVGKMLEIGLYQLVVLRNSFSRDERRQARAREHRKLIALMEQAWSDTQGGRVSPPRPW